MSYFTGIPLNSAGDRDVYIARTVMEMVSSSTSVFAAPDKIAIFPNPSNGIFTLKFRTEETDDVELSVYDVLGRTLQTYNTINTNTISLTGIQKANRVLLIKITLNDDSIIYKKPIY